MAPTKNNPSKDSTANLGFEAKLWLAANILATLRDTLLPKLLSGELNLADNEILK